MAPGYFENARGAKRGTRAASRCEQDRRRPSPTRRPVRRPSSARIARFPPVSRAASSSGRSARAPYRKAARFVAKPFAIPCNGSDLRFPVVRTGFSRSCDGLRLDLYAYAGIVPNASICWFNSRRAQNAIYDLFSYHPDKGKTPAPADLREAEFEMIRGLYAAGLVRQIWLRGDAGGACAIVEAASTDEVAEKFNALPFIREGYLQPPMIVPLKPYSGFAPRN